MDEREAPAAYCDFRFGSFLEWRDLRLLGRPELGAFSDAKLANSTLSAAELRWSMGPLKLLLLLRDLEPSTSWPSLSSKFSNA